MKRMKSEMFCWSIKHFTFHSLHRNVSTNKTSHFSLIPRFTNLGYFELEKLPRNEKRLFYITGLLKPANFGHHLHAFCIVKIIIAHSDTPARSHSRGSIFWMIPITILSNKTSYTHAIYYKKKEKNIKKITGTILTTTKQKL